MTFVLVEDLPGLRRPSPYVIGDGCRRRSSLSTLGVLRDHHDAEVLGGEMLPYRRIHVGEGQRVEPSADERHVVVVAVGRRVEGVPLDLALRLRDERRVLPGGTPSSPRTAPASTPVDQALQPRTSRRAARSGRSPARPGGSRPGRSAGAEEVRIGHELEHARGKVLDVA